MVTKEILERSFPSFDVQYAKLTKSMLFLLRKGGLSIQVTYYVDTKVCEYEIRFASELVEANEVDEMMLVEALKLKIKEHELE